MKLSTLQSDIAAKFAATPALVLLGAPLQYSLFNDDETQRSAIATALRTKGVCFEIGLPDAHAHGNNTSARETILDSGFDVYVAESPKVVHAPMNMALVNAVVAAIRLRSFPQEQVPSLVAYESAKSELGYALHIISFIVPVTVP